MTAYFRADDTLRVEALARFEQLAAVGSDGGGVGGRVSGSTALHLEQPAPTRRLDRLDVRILVSAFLGTSLAFGGAALVSWVA